MKTIDLHGIIGLDLGLNAQDLLSGVPDDEELTIRMNSPGGLTQDAFVLYNRLTRRNGSTTVAIEGVAASAATIVAMAADRITMDDNATFMVHAPWTATAGNAKELRERAERLDSEEAKMARVYARRTGLDEGKVYDLMAAETWMDADDAMANGFVDNVTTPGEDDSDTAAIIQNYIQATQRDKRLPVYALPRKWNPSAASASPTPQEESDMADDTNTVEPDALEERVAELEKENEELRSALEANREEVDEVAEEATEVAEERDQLAARVRELEDQNTRMELMAANIDPDDDLLALKRQSPKVFAKVVDRIRAAAPGTQPPIGRPGTETTDGSVSVARLVEQAAEAGYEPGKNLAVWVGKHHPSRIAEVMEFVRSN